MGVLLCFEITFARITSSYDLLEKEPVVFKWESQSQATARKPPRASALSVFSLERRIVLLYVISPMRVPLKLFRSDM